MENIFPEDRIDRKRQMNNVQEIFIVDDSVLYISFFFCNILISVADSLNLFEFAKQLNSKKICIPVSIYVDDKIGCMSWG